MSGRLRRAASVVAVALLLAAAPPGLAAQTAHATMSAVAVRLPTGSAGDPRDAEGTAWLLADVLRVQAERALRPLQALVDARVERGSTLFTLLAPVEVTAAARAVVDSVLFRAPLDSAVVRARRDALLAELDFQAGSPVADFDREAATILADPGSPFARPPQGTRGSVQKLDAAALAAYRRSAYDRDVARVAVVPPEATAPDTAPPDTTPPDTTAPDTTASPPTSGAPAPSGMLWKSGERHVLARDVTSAWLAVAYPAPAALSRTRLEFLAFALEEDLDPVPPDPDRYGVSVRVADTPGGSVLLVEATVLPEAADRWEAKIASAVEALRTRPPAADFFALRRRRFRGSRLLEDAAPDARAARATADLLRDGRVRGLADEIRRLEPGALRDAAVALGEPRIFRYGPDLRGGAGGSG